MTIARVAYNHLLDGGGQISTRKYVHYIFGQTRLRYTMNCAMLLLHYGYTTMQDVQMFPPFPIYPTKL